MLQYYKLALVRAGADSRLFKKELRRALKDLEDPNDREALRLWFRATVERINDM